VASINSFPTELLIEKKNILADEHWYYTEPAQKQTSCAFPRNFRKNNNKKIIKIGKKLDASASWCDNTAAQEARWW